MNKFILLLIFSFFSAHAQEISGPMGDSWDEKNVFHLKRADKPLYLTSETFIRAEKIVLDRTIVTNGFGLTIEARELVVAPEIEILTFDQAYFSQTFVDKTLMYSTQGGSCSISGNSSHEIGLNGSEGLSGLDVTIRPHDIKIFATLINGNLIVSSNGQQGGKGGKGGTGGKGVDGCKGRNGKAECSGLFGTGNGDAHHGENGKNGARGGYGGKGGSGGRGGENGILLLSYLKMNSSSDIKLSSLAGLGGEGGLPGDNGFSGKPGPGGDSDKKECGTFWDEETVTANAGNPGGVIEINESEIEREKRKGILGEAGKQHENVIKVSSFDELNSERQKVISIVSEFHFNRVFHQLIQQSLLIALNNDDIFAEISSINESARKKLISDWKIGFIAVLEKEDSLSENLKGLLDISKELVLLLENLSFERKEESQAKISLLLKKQRTILTQKVRMIASACLSYIEIDSSDLENKTELFTVPLCYTLQELTNNPLATLSVSKAVPLAVTGLKNDDFTFGDYNNSSRAPGSDFEIIIINNKKFGVRHFKDLYNLQERESTHLGSLRNLSVLKMNKLNINNIGAYTRLLREGMSK